MNLKPASPEPSQTSTAGLDGIVGEPTAIPPTLVTTLAKCVAEVTGRQPAVLGAPYPCDLFALQEIFGMPALLFGPAGGNAHAADEYLEMDSLFEFFREIGERFR